MIHWTRRHFLTSGGIAAATVAAYPVAFETQWLETTHHRVSVPGTAHVRVLHLSDLHSSWAVPSSLIERAFRNGLQSNPDLICLTGDFITHRSDFDTSELIRLLQGLSAACPTFAVLGNHDGGAWAQRHAGNASHRTVERILDQAGVTLLHNRGAQLEVRGLRLGLVGVGDLWSGELQPDAAFRSMERQGAVLLMSHNPDTKEELSRYHWDVMLSGHTHGGQVVIPFDGPRYAPVRDKRFVQGLHRWNGRSLYISRGVGSVGSVRFRCRPEVSVLDLVGGLPPSKAALQSSL